MNAFWYYHGTSNQNAKMILSQKHFIISDKIGTLGFGVYAFAKDIYSAKQFALRTRSQSHSLSDISIIKFKLCSFDQVIDLRDPDWLRLRDKYIQDNIKEINRKARIYNNNGLNKKLDGVITDQFIKQVNTLSTIPMKAVLSVTTNKIGKFVVYKTVTGNSLELCIKDNYIVDFTSMEIIKGVDVK